MTLRQAATSRRCSGCQSHQTCDNCTLPAVCCTPLLKGKTTELGKFLFSEKRRWLFNIKSTILYHVYLSSILSIVDKRRKWRSNHKRNREITTIRGGISSILGTKKLLASNMCLSSKNKNRKCPIDAHCHRRCRRDPRITKDCIEFCNF